MSFNDYANYLSQKYKLAVAIAVIKTKPENLDTKAYLEDLKSRINTNIDTSDVDIDVNSDDFNFDSDVTIDLNCNDLEEFNESIFNDSQLMTNDNFGTHSQLMTNDISGTDRHLTRDFVNNNGLTISDMTYNELTQRNEYYVSEFNENVHNDNVLTESNIMNDYNNGFTNDSLMKAKNSNLINENAKELIEFNDKLTQNSKVNSQDNAMNSSNAIIYLTEDNGINNDTLIRDTNSPTILEDFNENGNDIMNVLVSLKTCEADVISENASPNNSKAISNKEKTNSIKAKLKSNLNKYLENNISVKNQNLTDNTNKSIIPNEKQTNISLNNEQNLKTTLPSTKSNNSKPKTNFDNPLPTNRQAERVKTDKSPQINDQSNTKIDINNQLKNIDRTKVPKTTKIKYIDKLMDTQETYIFTQSEVNTHFSQSQVHNIVIEQNYIHGIKEKLNINKTEIEIIRKNNNRPVGINNSVDIFNNTVEYGLINNVSEDNSVVVQDVTSINDNIHSEYGQLSKTLYLDNTVIGNGNNNDSSAYVDDNNSMATEKMDVFNKINPTDLIHTEFMIDDVDRNNNDKQNATGNIIKDITHGISTCNSNLTNKPMNIWSGNTGNTERVIYDKNNSYYGTGNIDNKNLYTGNTEKEIHGNIYSKYAARNINNENVNTGNTETEFNGNSHMRDITSNIGDEYDAENVATFNNSQDKLYGNTQSPQNDYNSTITSNFSLNMSAVSELSSRTINKSKINENAKHLMKNAECIDRSVTAESEMKEMILSNSQEDSKNFKNGNENSKNPQNFENPNQNLFNSQDFTQFDSQETLLSKNSQNFSPINKMNENNNIDNNNSQVINNTEFNNKDTEGEIVSFKVLEELNKVKMYLRKFHENKMDIFSNDTGYKSDSQKSIKASQSHNWVNQSAYCLFSYLTQCTLALSTEVINKDISMVLGQLIDKLHAEESYPSFLEEILETVELLLQLVYKDDEFHENEVLKKDEYIQRILLFTKSIHIQKYTIEKIYKILENVHSDLKNLNSIQEINSIKHLENLCHIFHLLHILLKKYLKNKNLSQILSQNSSQNSQEIKKSDLSQVWKKKWCTVEEKTIGRCDTKCILVDTSDILNKLIVLCMDGYSLISYTALQSFNLIHNS